MTINFENEVLRESGESSKIVLSIIEGLKYELAGFDPDYVKKQADLFHNAIAGDMDALSKIPNTGRIARLKKFLIIYLKKKYPEKTF